MALDHLGEHQRLCDQVCTRLVVRGGGSNRLSRFKTRRTLISYRLPGVHVALGMVYVIIHIYIYIWNNGTHWLCNVARVVCFVFGRFVNKQ